MDARLRPKYGVCGALSERHGVILRQRPDRCDLLQRSSIVTEVRRAARGQAKREAMSRGRPHQDGEPLEHRKVNPLQGKLLAVARQPGLLEPDLKETSIGPGGFSALLLKRATPPGPREPDLEVAVELRPGVLLRQLLPLGPTRRQPYTRVSAGKRRRARGHEQRLRGAGGRHTAGPSPR